MSDDKPSNADFFEEEGAGEWLTTYADLVTLLMTFFVMLFAMSSMDAQKFREMIVSIQKSLGASPAVIELVAPDTKPEEAKPEERPALPPDIPQELLQDIDKGLLSDVQEFVEKTKLGEFIIVYREESRIVIQVEGQVFFASGEAALNPEALPILDDIVTIIQAHPQYQVNIKGHTDNIPIATALFPTNWELSAIRATTVLRHLIDGGVDPRRLTATGYGEVLPIAPNDTPENRSRNRRVEFVLEREKR